MSSGNTESLSGRCLADQYEIQQLVGEGAMGEVYAARHIALEQLVAVKTIRVDDKTDPVVISRFKSEALAASRLDHPNSVRIIDFGEEDDGAILYIVMEFLRGQDLGTLLRRTGRLSEQRALHIMNQILDALVLAHQNNIIHRDLKPANIMLVPSQQGGKEVVKVCDFGIAKLQDPLGSEDPTGMMTLTQAGSVVGTPSYMSPEQAGGRRVDARSDLFSCGAVMYHMLSGHKPFKSETLMGLLGQVMTEDPPPLSQRASTVDRRLEAIVNRALAKKPEDRFQSAREMRNAVAEVIDTPHDRTIALEGPPGAMADQTVALANPERFAVSESLFQRSGSSDSSIPRPMASLAGQTASGTGTWTRPASVSPASSPGRRSIWLSVLALSLVALGYLAYQHFKPRADINELAKHVSMGSWGSAEDYALRYFDAFKDHPEFRPLLIQTLELRRESTDMVEKAGIAFTAEYIVEASEWKGTLRFANRSETPAFVITIETIGLGHFTGYMDWPDRGIRARIRGFNHGNHLLFWDDEVMLGEDVRVKGFRLFDKKSVLLTPKRMYGFDGPFQVLIDAERAR